RTWGEELLVDPNVVNDAWRQPYIVVSFCRMLHSLVTGRVESKAAGVSWALADLDASWRALIERAQEKRKGQFSRVGKLADPADSRSTVEFILYAQSVAPTLG